MEMFRITKVDIGWIVEKLDFKYQFLGLHFYQVWRPYVKTLGLNIEWGHLTKEYAIMNLLDQVKKDTYGIY
jgi:hypothetical protein